MHFAAVTAVQSLDPCFTMYKQSLDLHVVPIACNDSYVSLLVVVGLCGKLGRLLKGCVQGWQH